MTSKIEGHRDELAPMIAALLSSKQYIQHIYDEEWEWFSLVNVPNVVQILVQLESFCGFYQSEKDLRLQWFAIKACLIFLCSQP